MWVVAVGLLSACVLQSGSLLDEFKRGESEERTAILRDSVYGRRPATNAQVEELFRLGMTDADSSVRADTVAIVASLLTLSNLGGGPARQEWVVRFAPVAEALRPELEVATRDPEWRVRMGALGGIIGESAYAAKTVSFPLAERLWRVFQEDPAPGVRGVALQWLLYGHRSSDERVRRLASQVLLKALVETDAGLVQMAGWSAGDAKLPEALPLLVEQLKNPSPAARMGVAAGIHGYGALAAPYLSQMEAALAKEPEGPTRYTLEAAVNLLRRRAGKGRAPRL